MSNTYKTKHLGKRKRLGKTTLKTELMMNHKCGAIDDKLDKIEALRKAELEIMKEIEELTT